MWISAHAASEKRLALQYAHVSESVIICCSVLPNPSPTGNLARESIVSPNQSLRNLVSRFASSVSYFLFLQHFALILANRNVERHVPEINTIPMIYIFISEPTNKHRFIWISLVLMWFGHRTISAAMEQRSTQQVLGKLQISSAFQDYLKTTKYPLIPVTVVREGQPSMDFQRALQYTAITALNGSVSKPLWQNAWKAHTSTTSSSTMCQ